MFGQAGCQLPKQLSALRLHRIEHGDELGLRWQRKLIELNNGVNHCRLNPMCFAKVVLDIGRYRQHFGRRVSFKIPRPNGHLADIDNSWDAMLLAQLHGAIRTQHHGVQQLWGKRPKQSLPFGLKLFIGHAKDLHSLMKAFLAFVAEIAR